MFKPVAAGLLFTVFVALWGVAVNVFTSAAEPWEFLAANALIVCGGFALAASYMIWLSWSRDRPAMGFGERLLLGIVTGLMVLVGTYGLLMWSNHRQQAFAAQERARQAINANEAIIQQLARQAYADQREIAARNAIMAQWNDIKETMQRVQEHGHDWSSDEKLSAAQRILDELDIVGRSVGVIAVAQGNGGLVLQVAPNTFRVTFSEPMVRVPDPIIRPSPSGAVPEALEVSTMGATIVFKPIASPVSLQEFLSLRPAFSAEF